MVKQLVSIIPPQTALDTTYFKYPSIPYARASSAIYNGRIYEKIDGSNCQVRIISGKSFGGTRSKPLQEYRSYPHPWMGDFERFIHTNPHLLSLSEQFIMYGEWLSNHNISYSNTRFSSPFILIDLF